jgi:hypothetical protein
MSWSTQNVTAAQVWVQDPYNWGGSEVLYDIGTSRANDQPPWISGPPHVFTFRPYDYSAGSRGALLDSVAVTATQITRVTPGPTTVGVYRGGSWYLNSQNDGSAPEFSFGFGGGSTDIPVVGDWNCDGVKTVGVFRDGAWYLKNRNDASAADVSFFYGAAADIPVVGDWDGDGCDGVGVFRNGTWYLTNQIGAALHRRLSSATVQQATNP